MKKLSLLAAIAFSSALLSGCLFPEKFTTRIDVNPDASYHVMFSGTAALVPAVMQITGMNKPLTVKDEDDLRKEAVKMSHEKSVKSAAYVGNGRFQIEIDDTRKAGQPMSLFDIFQVKTDKAGVMTISTPQVTDKDKSELSKLGLSINGTFDVNLPKGAEIISSNATSSPKFFGLIGTYSWKIGSVEVRPMIKFRIKK